MESSGKGLQGEQDIATRRARRYLAELYQRRALPEHAALSRVVDEAR